MGAADFGRLVRLARVKDGLSKSELARRLARLPESGRVFDAAGVTRIEEGGPVRIDRELVDRSVEVLPSLDPFDAYEAADLRPEGFTADDHRTFAAVGGAAASVAVVQAVGTKRNRALSAVPARRAA